jgi:hypothetical protein
MFINIFLLIIQGAETVHRLRSMNQIRDAMRINTIPDQQQEIVEGNHDDICADIVLAHGVEEAPAHDADELKVSLREE